MIYISSQPFFMPLFFANDRRRSTSIVISSGADCRYQEKWFCALWRRWVERSPPPYHGASSRRIAISPLFGAFAEMKRKRGEQLCQFAPCQWRMGHLLSDRLTIWKGLHHFFHSPCILRQRRRHPLRLMNPGRRAALQSQICYFNSIKNDVKFFNSTCWVKNESNETSTIKAGILTYELLR